MPDRALMPDCLRLVALFGIVAVNVQFMAFPTTGGFLAATAREPGDAVAIWLVQGLALLKTYGLFSFMVGVGLAFQIRSAERRGLRFGGLYRNRMIGLALLGLLHGLLFFPGDILLLYAVTGAILYRWRDWPVRRLLRVGAVLLAVQVLVAVVLTLNTPDPPADLLALERRTMTEGGWIDVVIYRAVSYAIIFPILLIYQGISALGWFCLGLAAVRSGLIDTPGHPLWARARRLCLLPGVAISLTGAALWQAGDATLGECIVIAAAPVATLGYLGLIAAMARAPGPVLGPVLDRVLPVGGSSLSIYLGQSIVLSTLFAPYGFGLWDAVGPLMAVAIAFAVTAALMALVLLWRRVFALGPFEWVLRRITRIGVGGP